MRVPYRSGMALRIVGSKVPATSGVRVYDAETLDEVDDIQEVDFTLTGSPAWIHAQVTFYERNAAGQKFIRDDKFAKKTENGNVVEVDITTKDSRPKTWNEILRGEPEFFPARTA